MDKYDSEEFLSYFNEKPIETIERIARNVVYDEVPKEHRTGLLAKQRKVILWIYLAVTLSMCIFFVPQNINYTIVSSQDVPHSVVTDKIYAPIWYNHAGDVREQNQIDIQRLSIQMAVLTIVCGVLYLTFKE